jgi:uncharacterized protein YciI
MIDENWPHYFAAYHSPGPEWVDGTPYDRQPGFEDHVAYIADCRSKGWIVPDNPFREASDDVSRIFAFGNVTIFRATDLEEAMRLGADDPTVRSGMLIVRVAPWAVPSHG